LISRVAGLGVLRHNAIGFTGPLSHHLLAYNSMINVVRSTLRDMIEVCMVNMLMTGCCNRDVNTFPNIAMESVDWFIPCPGLSLTIFRLPFLLPLNCALSIAVKSYLDELSNNQEPTAAATKAAVKETAATRYFPQSLKFIEDLEGAFAIWDAVARGVKSTGQLIPEKDRRTWSEADNWLAPRR
jgi:hypothetical protein